MPLQATSGAASYDGFGGGVAAVPTYIEDVFSTYLYTGTGAALTITNGIDTTTYGGLTWIKSRSGTTFHRLTDTARGVTKSLATNDSGGTATETTGLTAFGTTGFTIGADADYNTSAATYVSWTFREQPKFFDVVTYTGTGTARTINHNLGSVPGFIIVKSTSVAGSWYCYHRGTNGGVNPQNYGMNLGATAAQLAYINFWNNTAPTATQFTVGDSGGETNDTGVSYIAYLFAHDAGGFGLTGTDNVISCGSFTTVASEATINLGYEPQWVMVKSSSASGTNWQMYDTMRGFNGGNFTATTTAALNANSSSAESITGDAFPTATGFVFSGAASATYIYIAIRRGPMKVPTLGTSVYNAIARTGTGAAATITGVGFPPDLVITGHRTNPTFGFNKPAVDRLRGPKTKIYVDATSSEGTTTDSFLSFNMDGFSLGADGSEGNWNENSATLINWNFRRAPGFFDEVCYTGTGSATTQTHNLAAVPELMIVKRRNVARYWAVYASPLGATKWLELETVDPVQTDTMWNNTTPTASVFSIGTYNGVNGSGDTYVAYLFATCPGVSKVGSYTGTATTKQIDCGFTAGARFVLIKRTDSTGDWYVWDSARGIVAGNDPYLLLNSTAAEVTSTDYVDTYSAGFEISSTAPAAINASGGTFIFLAIA